MIEKQYINVRDEEIDFDFDDLITIDEFIFKLRIARDKGYNFVDVSWRGWAEDVDIEINAVERRLETDEEFERRRDETEKFEKMRASMAKSAEIRRLKELKEKYPDV
jgi:hypothetical protein